MTNKLKIRKGDRVKVIAGRSKGKVGDVLRVLPTEQRVVVAGVIGGTSVFLFGPLLVLAIQSLRLGGSKITGVGLAALARSKTLRSVTIGDLQVSDSALAPLLQKHVAVYGGAGAP